MCDAVIAGDTTTARAVCPMALQLSKGDVHSALG
jgi:hypothetical protein